jgi:hypothetical protein
MSPTVLTPAEATEALTELHAQLRIQGAKLETIFRMMRELAAEAGYPVLADRPEPALRVVR